MLERSSIRRTALRLIAIVALVALAAPATAEEPNPAPATGDAEPADPRVEPPPVPIGDPPPPPVDTIDDDADAADDTADPARAALDRYLELVDDLATTARRHERDCPAMANALTAWRTAHIDEANTLLAALDASPPDLDPQEEVAVLGRLDAAYAKLVSASTSCADDESASAALIDLRQAFGAE